MCAALALWAPVAHAGIIPRGAALTSTFNSNSTTSVTLGVPAGAQPGDVLIATLAVGRDGGKPPSITPPSGWSQVLRTTAEELELGVYQGTVGSANSLYTFRTGAAVGGTATMTAYAGVDAARPIDAHNQKGYTKTATSVPAPSLSTTRPGTLLLGLFAGDGGGATWTAPASMTEVADLAGGDRSQAVTQTAMPSAGSTGQRTAIASRSLSSSVGALVALNPAASPPPPPPPPPPTGAVGLIVDTDMFSSADDVGALATAFGLQLRGEANVLAVTVNTRTSRPTVARNSWRCVAAINSFYGAAGIPIGTHKPDDGTATNIVDWAGPCASLAPSSTPTPGAAVDVLRRTLAGQPDHSVVIASAGYFGNLSDLLNSPGDAISPLSGRDLVALKVNRLVSMGGGYPSRSGETNLSGDPAAASNVASNWPTKIVWSGYEVGDAIHTGQTISSTHPSLSPVRKAYEAFVGPNNWIYSYDLTAVYHAVRPQDTQLSEVGPGTNAVNSSGGRPRRHRPHHPRAKPSPTTSPAPRSIPPAGRPSSMVRRSRPLAASYR
jgi:inosine-uridine nucleoside N-ribohydrolase